MGLVSIVFASGVVTVILANQFANQTFQRSPSTGSSNPFLWLMAQQIERLDASVKHLQLQLNQERSKKDAEISSLHKSIHQIKEDSKGPAFFALLNHSLGLKRLAPGEVLKFENVKLNRGDGYSAATGIFTVPRSGVYSVFCTVRSNGGKHLHVTLYKNKSGVCLAYGGYWNTGSLQAVLQLIPGDQLYIKHESGPHVVNEDIQGSTASFFSAVFISE